MFLHILRKKILQKMKNRTSFFSKKDATYHFSRLADSPLEAGPAFFDLIEQHDIEKSWTISISRREVEDNYEWYCNQFVEGLLKGYLCRTEFKVFESLYKGVSGDRRETMITLIQYAAMHNIIINHKEVARPLK